MPEKNKKFFSSVYATVQLLGVEPLKVKRTQDLFQQQAGRYGMGRLPGKEEVNRMARLQELSGQYREAAARLGVGLEAAKQRLESQEGTERQVTNREILMLRQMLREMRELRQLAEEYYTRPRSGKYTTADLTAPRINEEKR